MRTFEHKTIAVDIDGVILDSMQGNFDRKKYDPLNFEDFPTMDGCIEVLTKLKDQGYVIILYTARMNIDWAGNKGYTLEELGIGIEKEMRLRNIPFDIIAPFKPIADIYIDDRGYHFKTWAITERDLKTMGCLEWV